MEGPVYRIMTLSICLLLFTAAMVVAEEPAATVSGDPDAKVIKGMSVLGNDEAPMSLFIVPWKSSELGVGTNLTRTLSEHDVPVDREVFMREVAYYEVSVGSKTK